MKKGAVFLFLFILLVSASTACNDEQIDINEASLGGLDELTGIGPAKAQSIIDARPFSKIDDLIHVSGIGEVTLQNIKDQGLACVADNDNDGDEEDADEKVGDDNEENTKDGESSKNQGDKKKSSEHLKENKKIQEAGGIVIMEFNNSPKTVINLKSSKDVEQIKETVYESKNERIKKYSGYAFSFLLILIIAYLLFS